MQKGEFSEDRLLRNVTIGTIGTVGILCLWSGVNVRQARNDFREHTLAYFEGQQIPACTDGGKQPCYNDIDPSSASAVIVTQIGERVVHCTFDGYKPGCYIYDPNHPDDSYNGPLATLDTLSQPPG